MEYATRYLQAKENVLREVLTQYLGRTPTLNDARKVEIGRFQDGRNYELLAYDGKHLGRIEESRPEEFSIKLTFIP